MYGDIDELTASYNANKDSAATQGKGTNHNEEQDPKYRRRRRQLELAIREAFLRFMTSVMQNYKQFMRTVTRRPNQTALDRNLASFFDCEGKCFLKFF